MRIMRAKQEIEEARMKYMHLTEVSGSQDHLAFNYRLIDPVFSQPFMDALQELNQKQEHRLQRVSMAAEHKTRAIHEINRRHLEQRQQVSSPTQTQS